MRVTFRRTIGALLSCALIALPVSSAAQDPPDPPKLMRCAPGALCFAGLPANWIEVPPGSVLPLPNYVGGRTDGIHPPVDVHLAEGWGWTLTAAAYTANAALFYLGDPQHGHFEWYPSDALPSPVDFFSGPWIAGFKLECSPSSLYTLKFFYTPPHPPNTPQPGQQLAAISFSTDESSCYAPSTTHPNPNNRPPSNGPEAGQEPDFGEEPDPETACSAVGQPVEVTTGNVFFDQTDLVVPWQGAPVRFTRSYNSKNAGLGGMFGPGWTFSYERGLTFPSQGEIVLHEGRGTSMAFSDANADGVFEPRRRAKHANTFGPAPFGQWKRSYARGGSEIFDKYGRLNYVYDAAGNSTLISRSGTTIIGVNDFQLVPGPNGRPQQLIAPGGQTGIVVASYTYYDGEGPDALLKTVTYPDGSGYRFIYYPVTRELKEVLDLEGNILETHTYVDGKAATSEIANGKEKYTFAYAPGQTTVTDALNHQTIYDWTTIGDQNVITKITGPCGGCGGGQEVQEWTYDPTTAAVSTYKNGLGKVTSYTYYSDTKRLETVTRKPDPATTYLTRYTYVPDGRVHERFDANGGVTTLSYGAAGPTQISENVTSTDTRTTSIEYHPIFTAKPWKITDPRGKQTELTYSFQFPRSGWLESITDPLTNVTQFEYDALGRRTRVVLPVTLPATEEPKVYYDTPGRVRFVVDPGGTAGNPDDPLGTCTKCTLYKYDKGGRLTLRKDAYGREVRYGYDPYGRLETITQPFDATTDYVTRFSFDDMSNLQTITDPRGKVTDFDYDDYDRVRTITYPPVAGQAPRVEQFTYFGDGSLSTRTDRKGITTTFIYDDIGRLKQKTYSDGSPTVNYGYDASGLTSASIGSSSLSWTYDFAGQLRTATDAQGTIVYDYELTGQRKSLNFSNGAFALTYEYDDAGRLRYIRRGTQAFEFVPDQASRRRELRYPNGTTTKYTPDALSRLSHIELSLGQTVLNAIHYTYDDVWNVDSKESGGVNEHYDYDAAYRLTGVQRNGQTVENYAYDAAGNRTTPPRQWPYNDRNELLSMGVLLQQIVFEYDLNGNRTKKGPVPGGLASTWDYEWDVENRLTRVLKDQAEVARFNYDPLGRRATKTAGGVTTQYTYDGMDILRETRSGAFDYFIHGPRGDEPLAQEDTQEDLTYYHADALGSIVKRTDAASQVAASYGYAAYGNPETSHPGGYGYTGREWDPEAQLYYYRARYYDPIVGRFISPDPVGFGGGMNLYAYVRNRPTNLLDPSGLAAIMIDPKWGYGRRLAEMNPLERALLPVDAMMPMSTAARVGIVGTSGIYRGSKLARNMCAAGRPVAQGTEEAHHVIARLSKKAAEARQILVELGIEIDAAANGVALPKTVHRGLHTDAYYLMVNIAAREWKTANEAVEGLLFLARSLVE